MPQPILSGIDPHVRGMFKAATEQTDNDIDKLIKHAHERFDEGDDVEEVFAHLWSDIGHANPGRLEAALARMVSWLVFASRSNEIQRLLDQLAAKA